MRLILSSAFTLFFAILFASCSDPQAEKEIARKEAIVQSYQAKIEKVKTRLDSLKEKDKAMQVEMDSLDMRR